MKKYKTLLSISAGVILSAGIIQNAIISKSQKISTNFIWSDKQKEKAEHKSKIDVLKEQREGIKLDENATFYPSKFFICSDKNDWISAGTVVYKSVQWENYENKETFDFDLGINTNTNFGNKKISLTQNQIKVESTVDRKSSNILFKIPESENNFFTSLYKISNNIELKGSFGLQVAEGIRSSQKGEFTLKSIPKIEAKCVLKQDAQVETQTFDIKCSDGKTPEINDNFDIEYSSFGNNNFETKCIVWDHINECESNEWSFSKEDNKLTYIGDYNFEKNKSFSLSVILESKYTGKDTMFEPVAHSQKFIVRLLKNDTKQFAKFSRTTKISLSPNKTYEKVGIFVADGEYYKGMENELVGSLNSKSNIKGTSTKNNTTFDEISNVEVFFDKAIAGEDFDPSQYDPTKMTVFNFGFKTKEIIRQNSFVKENGYKQYQIKINRIPIDKKNTELNFVPFQSENFIDIKIENNKSGIITSTDEKNEPCVSMSSDMTRPSFILSNSTVGTDEKSVKAKDQNAYHKYRITDENDNEIDDYMILDTLQNWIDEEGSNTHIINTYNENQKASWFGHSDSAFAANLGIPGAFSEWVLGLSSGLIMSLPINPYVMLASIGMETIMQMALKAGTEVAQSFAYEGINDSLKTNSIEDLETSLRRELKQQKANLKAYLPENDPIDLWSEFKREGYSREFYETWMEYNVEFAKHQTAEGIEMAEWMNTHPFPSDLLEQRKWYSDYTAKQKEISNRFKTFSQEIKKRDLFKDPDLNTLIKNYAQTGENCFGAGGPPNAFRRGVGVTEENVQNLSKKIKMKNDLTKKISAMEMDIEKIQEYKISNPELVKEALMSSATNSELSLAEKKVSAETFEKAIASSQTEYKTVKLSKNASLLSGEATEMGLILESAADRIISEVGTSAIMMLIVGAISTYEALDAEKPGLKFADALGCYAAKTHPNYANRNLYLQINPYRTDRSKVYKGKIKIHVDSLEDKYPAGRALHTIDYDTNEGNLVKDVFVSEPLTIKSSDTLKANFSNELIKKIEPGVNSDAGTLYLNNDPTISSTTKIIGRLFDKDGNEITEDGWGIDVKGNSTDQRKYDLYIPYDPKTKLFAIKFYYKNDVGKYILLDKNIETTLNSIFSANITDEEFESEKNYIDFGMNKNFLSQSDGSTCYMKTGEIFENFMSFNSGEFEIDNSKISTRVFRVDESGEITRANDWTTHNEIDNYNQVNTSLIPPINYSGQDDLFIRYYDSETANDEQYFYNSLSTRVNYGPLNIDIRNSEVTNVGKNLNMFTLKTSLNPIVKDTDWELSDITFDLNQNKKYISREYGFVEKNELYFIVEKDPSTSHDLEWDFTYSFNIKWYGGITRYTIYFRDNSFYKSSSI